MECSVCCLVQTEKNMIGCLECHYQACHVCIQTYLLNLTSDPHCINCRCVWDMLFLKKYLSQEFLNGVWKERRIELLWKRFQSYSIENGMSPCPSCPHGMLDRETKCCSSCWLSVCATCFCPQDKNHRCNPEIVKSLETIQQTTRQCPQCHVPIEKQSGCFQMFCTQCYTPFDWEHGTILEKHIHNPHYFSHQENKVRIHDMDHISDLDTKRKWKEFGSLLNDIEQQMKQFSPQKITWMCLTKEQLYEQDVLRQQQLSQYLLWVTAYRKGLALYRETFTLFPQKQWEVFSQKFRYFQKELQEILLEYNEHVATCLQLRGHRLFPCHPPILCL